MATADSADIPRVVFEDQPDFAKVARAIGWKVVTASYRGVLGRWEERPAAVPLCKFVDVVLVPDRVVGEVCIPRGGEFNLYDVPDGNGRTFDCSIGFSRVKVFDAPSGDGIVARYEANSIDLSNAAAENMNCPMGGQP